MLAVLISTAVMSLLPPARAYRTSRPPPGPISSVLLLLPTVKGRNPLSVLNFSRLSISPSNLYIGALAAPSIVNIISSGSSVISITSVREKAFHLENTILGDIPDSSNLPIVFLGLFNIPLKFFSIELIYCSGNKKPAIRISGRTYPKTLIFILVAGKIRAVTKAMILRATTVLNIPALLRSERTTTLPAPEPIRSAKYSFPLIPENSVNSMEYKYPPIRNGIVPKIMYIRRLLTLGSR